MLLAIFVVSIAVASNKQAAIYGMLRISELLLFGISAKSALEQEGKKVLPRLGIVFSIGVLGSSVLAILQFFKQSSIGGILYFIGERSFSSETPGIANASINGALLLRPYAAFPHPNVLAWYLFVGVALCVTVFILRKRFFLSPILTALLVLAIGTGSVAILLTLSRSVLIAFVIFILCIPFIFCQKLKKVMLIGFYASSVAVLAGLLLFTPIGGRLMPLLHSDKALVERETLLFSAQKMFLSAPATGVGINNFIVQLPRFFPHGQSHLFLQPVHAIYLVILAETGVAGLSLFFYLLWKTGVAAASIKDVTIRFVMQYLFLASLLLGLVDHYMVTLEQGQILFVFLISCCYAFQTKVKLQK